VSQANEQILSDLGLIQVPLRASRTELELLEIPEASSAQVQVFKSVSHLSQSLADAALGWELRLLLTCLDCSSENL